MQEIPYKIYLSSHDPRGISAPCRSAKGADTGFAELHCRKKSAASPQTSYSLSSVAARQTAARDPAEVGAE